MRATTRLGCLLALVLVGTIGCTDYNSGLSIQGSVLGEADEDTCSWGADGTLLPQGRYNIDFPEAYEVYPLYANNLVSRTGSLTSDPNGLHIRGVEVQIMDAGRSPIAFGGLPNPFTIPTSTFVPPSADGQSAGRSVGAVTIIPEAYRSQLTTMGLAAGTLLVVDVLPFGRTVGGNEVDGTPWQWVVELCNDTCLFACPGFDDEVGGCTPGQDSSIFHPCGCGVDFPGCDIGAI